VNETILYAKNYKYIAFSQLLSHVWQYSDTKSILPKIIYRGESLKFMITL
jgi:hypothetical protein